MDLRKCIAGVVEPVLVRGKYVGIGVGVLQDGRKATFGFGRKSAGSKAPPDDDSLFEIGSITKVFTATLLACLKNEGLVSYEDPIRKHLPDGVKVASRNGKVIRLHHLATHTSGLPRLPDNLVLRDEENPYADYRVEDLEKFMAKAKLGHDPGEAYEYSNVGGGLLGHLLALRTGLSFGQALASRICAPLELNDTRVDLTDPQKGRLLAGHSPDGRKVPYWDIPTLSGAGALRSSVNDQLRFLEANLGNAPEPLFSALSETHQARAQAGGGMKIGLGWHISPMGTPDKSVLHWHNGGTGGFSSFAGFIKERRLGVVVLGNSAEQVDGLAHSILIRLAGR